MKSTWTRTFAAVALFAQIVSGCSAAKRKEQVRIANPEQFDELTMVAPQCGSPEKEDVETCREAALLIKLDPPAATQRFLQFWAACGRAERDRRHTKDFGERMNARGGGPIFELAFAVVNLVGTAAEAKAIRAEGRFEDQGAIVVPVLRQVYARSELSYAEAMKSALEEVQWTSYESYVVFGKTHGREYNRWYPKVIESPPDETNGQR